MCIVDDTCFNSGSCGVGSPFVGYQTAQSLEECRESCDQNSNCGYFSYDPNNALCLMYAECENFSPSNCPECSSGSSDCELQKCFKTGFCYGDQVNIGFFEDVNECVRFCHETEGCEYWSYDPSANGLCMLTSNCPSKVKTSLTIHH